MRIKTIEGEDFGIKILGFTGFAHLIGAWQDQSLFYFSLSFHTLY